MQRKQFQKLYTTLFDPIYRFIYFRVGGDVEVAEDLTSEVFMKALEHIEKLDEDNHPKAWLYTVARNKLKNHYRDKKVEVDIDKVAPFLEGEDGRVMLEKLGDEHVLLEAMDRLEKEDRRIIEMKHLEGFSFKDIAEILGKKPGAIRVKSHRAMKKLRKLIKV
ncbi:sigma-70 family RNA polymerase sigma factor [Candidatus Uhrbacteria bacterium]|jgi:RNA polymerase sigma-70 factor, ECF subfamily|nr:sigma-70 family RNA polymerase sigma factor [Candidatus Uhrbacteria bacterium]